MNRYSEYRNQIKSGDLLAWSHRPWGSFYDFKIQMVRVFTRSEYSHVGVAWVVAGRVFVVEAVEPLVRIYPLSKLGDFYHTPMGIDLTPVAEDAMISYVGTRYSQLDAVRAFFEPLGDNVVSECAALVLQIYKHNNIDLGNRATPDAVVKAAQLLGHPTFLVTNS